MANYHDTLIFRAAKTYLANARQLAPGKEALFLNLSRGTDGLSVELTSTFIDDAGSEAVRDPRYAGTVMITATGAPIMLDLRGHGRVLQADEEADAALEARHMREIASAAVRQ